MTEREDELAWRELVLDEKEHGLNRILAQEGVEGSDRTKVGKAERVLDGPSPSYLAVGASGSASASE